MIEKPQSLAAGIKSHHACAPTTHTTTTDGQHDPLHPVIDALRADLKAARTKIGHLETALQSNRRIGAALGVLMARQRISLDAAFTLLSAASQHRNRKLRDVAEDVLYTGTLDGASPSLPTTAG